METTAKEVKKPTKAQVAKLEKLEKLVKARKAMNNKFAKASQSQKIVMVAKDVIEQLKKKKYIASPGVYVSFTGKKMIEPDTKVDQFIFDVPSCQVCAVGAMFCSAVMLGDNVVGTDIEVYSSVYSKRYFSWDNFANWLDNVIPQLLLHAMEKVFENRGYNGYHPKNATKRMIGLCENLIKNKGKKLTDPKNKQQYHLLWEEN